MNKKTARRRVVLGALLLLAVVASVWLYITNTRVGCTLYTVQDSNIPDGFKGYKLAQVSDLHCANFDQVIQILKEQQPDIIAITGDLLDSYHPNVNKVLDFAANAMEIAPCYYVTGNHEARLGEEYSQLDEGLRSAGVIMLQQTGVEIERGGDRLYLMGIDDPECMFPPEKDEQLMQENIRQLIQQTGITEGYRILLSHRAEGFEAYCQEGINLVLSGYAHGGQVRLPLVGGVYAPGQGLLPKYTQGMYRR